MYLLYCTITARQAYIDGHWRARFASPAVAARDTNCGALTALFEHLVVIRNLPYDSYVFVSEEDAHVILRCLAITSSPGSSS